MRTSPDVTGAKVQQFRALTGEFSAMCAAEGLTVRAYNSEGPSYFASLPEALQDAILSRFVTYVEVCRDVLAHGGRIRDDQVLLWRMIQKLRLHPPADLLENFKQGDCIEIYDQEFHQVYRNLGFFEICSYTLDEMLSRPLWELVRRDEEIQAGLIDMARTVLSGQVNQVLMLDFPEHDIIEIDSPKKLHSVIWHRLAAPLKNSDGVTEALVNFFECRSCRPTANED